MRYELFGINPESGQWRWEESRTLEAVANYQTYLRDIADRLTLDEWYLDNLTATNTKLNFVRKNDEGTVQYYVPPSEGKLLSDNWMDITLSGNETEEFDTEKSVDLLTRIVSWATADDKEAIVIDFFAGSGTTAHAVMAQNGLDGGRRKFILVQLPDEIPGPNGAAKARTIADVTKDRLLASGALVKSGENHEAWDGDVGFRVLKVDTSNMAEVHYTPRDVKQSDLLGSIENVKPGRDNPEDLLFQVLVDWGVDLTLPIRKETIKGKTVFFVSEEPYDLIACFDKGISEELVKELGGHKPMRMVFRDNGFDSDAAKINAKQILLQLSPETDVKAI